MFFSILGPPHLDYDWKRSRSARSTRWEVYHRQWQQAEEEEEEEQEERRRKSMTFDHLVRSIPTYNIYTNIQ